MISNIHDLAIGDGINRCTYSRFKIPSLMWNQGMSFLLVAKLVPIDTVYGPENFTSICETSDAHSIKRWSHVGFLRSRRYLATGTKRLSTLTKAMSDSQLTSVNDLQGAQLIIR